ncbi:hypothetical protein KSP39_PZI003506 [Platanthera zijinensis]|uniref:Uncharacterized protein n=1 Tax=Platanthera zijinensis TaxID=2320716 RepID=A0AAP0BXR9_9ASPA
MKQHLAGVKGNIAACKKIPHDIRIQMQENLKEITTKKQIAEESLDSVNPYDDNSQHSRAQEKGKRKLDQVDNYFAPRTSAGSQPSIKIILASKEVVHHADMMIARWFYDSCIPFNALNSVFAQKAINAIAAIGPGYKLPSYI